MCMYTKYICACMLPTKHIFYNTFYKLNYTREIFISFLLFNLDFQSDNKEERARAKAMCDKLWPGWDKRIIEMGLRKKHRIDNISKLCSISKNKMN